MIYEFEYHDDQIYINNLLTNKIKMWNIYDHLNMVKIRPWMYIWSNKISDLRLYIWWYFGCLFEKWINENEIPKFQNFHEWIAKYYWYNESTSWWANMILDNSKDEEDALKTFFILLEKFKNEKN